MSLYHKKTPFSRKFLTQLVCLKKSVSSQGVFSIYIYVKFM
ncbi:hypothetical protein RUMHYD_00379 [Blautia hydrogenotrophica DSM 10507]|uniref:Uncharacterized protein n=1 Tax=Blautia hydrogenotrophica (strain DSM 10507 / JCM 14656 / S5a33) TaxID=476272 RepID=C0CHR4_BLAHS|nr:hypothetical protein RUMHYD_00379 [Blautia hydrogenotrophica DSM 10507]